MTVATARVAGADRADEALANLRERFPGAIFERYLGLYPRVGENALVAASAVLIGDVTIGDDASVWYGSVLRGDIARIEIGARTNIQDGTVIHVADDTPCVVGDDVVVGHRAVLHACRVENGCLIGMQATVLDEAVVGHGSVVGAGAVVTQRTVIPPSSLALGMPAKIARTLPPETEAFHRSLAAKYVDVKDNYLRG